MGAFKDIEEARAFFEQDRFATVNGMKLDELFDGGAVCSVTLNENHYNAMNNVMGGVVFTLADFAFAAAANNDHRFCVGLESHIHFLAAAKGAKLTAEAARVKSGRTTAVYEVKVRDDLGRDVALYVATAFKC